MSPSADSDSGSMSGGNDMVHPPSLLGPAGGNSNSMHGGNVNTAATTALLNAMSIGAPSGAFANNTQTQNPSVSVQQDDHAATAVSSSSSTPSGGIAQVTGTANAHNIGTSNSSNAMIVTPQSPSPRSVSPANSGGFPRSSAVTPVQTPTGKGDANADSNKSAHTLPSGLVAPPPTPAPLASGKSLLSCVYICVSVSVCMYVCVYTYMYIESERERERERERHVVLVQSFTLASTRQISWA